MTCRKEQPAHISTSNKVRAIAFHLPQFHPIPENDKWWGKGFTEWTNVAKASPLFTGHHQPHIPAELGFYDLRLPEARQAQANLARDYGIHGFCYYHYWFNGKLLLETPIHEMLKSGEPDFPFCLCWANEDWTRAWDGSSDEKLMEQHYKDSDDVRHMHYLANFFDDPRYIRVDGKPLFLVYRANQMPDPLHTTTTWREVARKLGHADIYLCRVESFSDEHTNPVELGFDAAVEFQPDWVEVNRVQKLDVPESKNISVYNYADVVRKMLGKQSPDYKRFPCVFPSWDNSPRRNTNAVVIHDSSPQVYKNWLKESIKKVQHNTADEQIVFINAWNEWGEGNHLEPEAKFGRGYLLATKEALNGIHTPEYKYSLSIVIVVQNQLEILRHCLDAIKRTINNRTFEIIVLDNASTDGSSCHLNTLVETNVSVLLNSADMGIDYACKQAAEIAQGESLVFLKCLPELPREWLDILYSLHTDDYMLKAISTTLGVGMGVDYSGCDCLMINHDIYNQVLKDIDIAEAYHNVANSGVMEIVQRMGYKARHFPLFSNIFVFKFNDDVYEQDGNGWLAPDAMITVPRVLLRRPVIITFTLYSPRCTVFKNNMLAVKIFVDEAPVQAYVFTRDNEIYEVRLQIDTRNKDATINIRSNDYFVPSLLGESTDSRELSIILQNLQYHF